MKICLELLTAVNISEILLNESFEGKTTRKHGLQVRNMFFFRK